MEVDFNEKIYKKNGRNGHALKNLCFDIFNYYLKIHNNIDYKTLQNIFNQWHCNNNFVVLNKNEWETKTEDLKNRYFKPIEYNNELLYFTTQWGNNGGKCDNVNNMINFAKEEGYNINVLNSDKNEKSDLSFKMNIKNIILYGAPGVGKTHNYKKLISLIEEGKSQKDIFDIIQNNELNDDNSDIYKSLEKEKRVEFITFHQSFGYEDFIEGFRPNEDGKIKLENGIFKLISEKAIENKKQSKKSKIEISKNKKFQIEMEYFKEVLENSIEKEGYYPITEAAYLTGFDDESFRYNIRRENPTYRYDLRMKFEDLIKFNDSNILSRQDVKNLQNINSLANQHASYYFKVYQEIIKNRANISQEDVEEVSEKNFYLVIDEINRGNISKVFGELITLIEESKRDNYEVTLPYSKQKFSVPSNLYIIGTMNTTDKSIALIDVALRRRFTFIEMKPNSNLVSFISARKLMDDINKKIVEDGLGKEYKIGHSYFMNINSKEELEFLKVYKLKPLLEEYYYGDDRLKQILQLIDLED